MRRDDFGPTEEAIPEGASEGALDLSPLRERALASADPGDARWEALARRIEAAAAPELTRRRAAAPDLALFLARARRPALLAAAAAAAFAIATARLVQPDPSLDESPPVGVAQALRVDEPAATWLVAGRAPSTADLAREIGLDQLAAGVAQ